MPDVSHVSGGTAGSRQLTDVGHTSRPAGVMDMTRGSRAV